MNNLTEDLFIPIEGVESELVHLLLTKAWNNLGKLLTIRWNSTTTGQ